MISPTWLPWSTIIKGAAILAILVSFFLLGFKANNDIWSAKWAKRDAKDAEQALQVLNEINRLEQVARANEHKIQAIKQDVEETYATQVTKLSNDLSNANSTNRRLRDSISAYSSSSNSSTNSSTVCTNNDRAKTLGVLLTEATELAAEGLGDAGRYSDQIIALKAYIRRVCFNAFNSPKVVPSGN